MSIQPAKHGDQHGPLGPDPIPITSGLRVASLSANLTISPTGPGEFFEPRDLSGAILKTNTPDLTKQEDPGPPFDFWGIGIPPRTLFASIAWMEMRDPAPDNADGEHAVSICWQSPSPTIWGPAPDGQEISGYVTDWAPFVGTMFATAAAYELQIGQNGGFSDDVILGVAHNYNGWTVDPVDWKFGLLIILLGDVLA